MKKIKVLQIITRLIVGGAQDVALSLASELDKDKFEVTFVSGPQDFCVEMAAKWKVEVIVFSDLIRKINPFKDLVVLIKLYNFIKRNKFDIVHTHTSKAGILGRVAARLAGVPIIFHTPHGSIFHSIYYGPRAIFLLSRLENFVASFTDKIINCANNERKDFLEHNISTEDKYTTIYWGIRQDEFLKAYDRDSKRERLGISAETILIGNITRLVSEKGHMFCLEAFKITLEVLPNAKLLIAGDGILREKIEEKIKQLDLSSNVIMLGHRKDVAELLNCLDISVHTSAWEGTPLAIIEAMLMGKAIIATRVGGIPELINNGKTGILIPSGDRGALAEAIIKLAKDRMFANSIGQAAQDYAKEKFTVESMMRKITNLYESFVYSKLPQKNV
ncbi:MAG: glycosyltransferase family 4 protein [Candidatus Omnitrophota bacterium]